MHYEKDQSIKRVGGHVQVWNECLSEMQRTAKGKLRIVYWLMLLIFILIGAGFYLLYPFERSTTYLMIVDDPDYGNYLLEQELGQYKAGLVQRYPENNGGTKAVKEADVELKKVLTPEVEL